MTPRSVDGFDAEAGQPTWVVPLRSDASIVAASRFLPLDKVRVHGAGRCGVGIRMGSPAWMVEGFVMAGFMANTRSYDTR